MKKLVIFPLFIGMMSCGPSLNQTTVICSTGRTLLDGVCVAEGVVDYVACVRAQGAQLDAGKRQQLAADIGYLQAKVGGSAELSETLQRKYTVSDQAILEIVRTCSAFAGPAASAPLPPTAPTSAATAAPTVDQRTFSLYKGAGPNIYLVSGGKRYWIPDPETFAAMGMDWSTVQTVDDTVLTSLGDPGALPRLSEGALVKGSGPMVYRLQQGQRRSVPDVETFHAMGLDWNQVITLPDAAILAIPEGAGYPRARASP